MYQYIKVSSPVSFGFERDVTVASNTTNACNMWNFSHLNSKSSNLGWLCRTETIEAFLKTFGISEIAVCAVRPSPAMSYVRRIWLARRSVCRSVGLLAAATAALRIIIERARRRLQRPT